MKQMDIEQVVDGFIDAMLYTNDSGHKFGGQIQVAAGFRSQVTQWVTDFNREHGGLAEEWTWTKRGSVPSWRFFGDSLYMTSARHGTGFWDDEFIPEDLGQRLTEAAHTMPEDGLGYMVTNGELEVMG